MVHTIGNKRGKTYDIVGFSYDIVGFAEKKAEQLAPDSSPGLAHHPKMGAYSYTPLSVFEQPSDIKTGPEGDPAGSIAVNTRAVEPRGTSSKSTSDPCHGCTSPFIAGVAGKPRIQRPSKFAVAATKDKAKDKEQRTAPSHLPVRQELPFDSDSEGASATIASVRKHPPPRTNYQPTIAHYRIDTRNGDWNIHQPANGDEELFAALAFRCLADDRVGRGAQGALTSAPRPAPGALLFGAPRPTPRTRGAHFWRPVLRAPQCPCQPWRMTTLRVASSVLARLQAFPKIRC